MITEIFFILILTVPTIYAVWEDRNGDEHPNHDWVGILVVMVICSLVVGFIDGRMSFAMDFIRALCLSIAIYVLLFNWLIGYVLWKRGVIELKPGKKWYNHYSKTAIPDKWMIWNTARWWQKLFFQILIAMWPAAVYLCPCRIVSYYNTCFTCR